MIIALSGYAQSGKDSVSEILIKKYGYKRVSFADKIKEILLEINPIILGYEDLIWDLATYVNNFGWENSKKVPHVRQLLQNLGVSVREVLGEDTWIDAALDGVLPNDKIVITDVRFPNEADAIKWIFGEIWRVERPKISPVNKHASETALDDWIFDRTITNNGTLEDLEELVDVIMEPLTKEAKNDTI